MNMLKVKKLKPNPFSVSARLPEVYTKFCKELKKLPAPVHYIPEPGRWKYDPQKKLVMRVENVPVPLKFPKEADEGIWGGEGIVQGFVKRKLKKRKYPHFWIPSLQNSIVYSEILNKYMSVTVTQRALQLIDKHLGFDNYILETPVQDLKSQLALDLRRRMLLALVNREKNYEDETVQQKIWDKYKHFEIPKEEAEWFGLSMKEAVRKQKLLEEETMKPGPLKHQLRKAYIEELKAKKSTEESAEPKSTTATLVSKLPFVGSKS